MSKSPPNIPNGAPIWADFTSSDLKASQAFYSGLFGWTFDPSMSEEYGGYTNARLDGRYIAGFTPHYPEMGPADIWGIYLRADDLETTIRAVPEAGGKVLIPAMHIAPYGTMAILEAPGGAMVGAWQPQEHAGFGATGAPGTPVWFETVTGDYAAAVRFYQQVFGWKTDVMDDSPSFGYTTLGKDRDAVAGIMDTARSDTPNQPATWRIYWGVEDADAAVKQVESLGGKILKAPYDTPYGRMVDIQDVTGASLMLVGRGS